MKLIILAAGQGTRLRPLSDGRPKAMTPLAGRPLLEWQIEAAAAAGLDDVLLVGGYESARLQALGKPIVCNEAFADTNMVHSLFCAAPQFGDDFIMAYGDIVYRPAVLARLLESDADTAVVIDRDWRRYWEARFDDPLSDAESLEYDEARGITSIGQAVDDADRIQAQYIGLVRFRGDGVHALKDTWAELGRPPRLFMTDLLQAMADRGHRLSPCPINGGWVEIDTLSDLSLAERLLAEGRLAA